MKFPSSGLSVERTLFTDNAPLQHLLDDLRQSQKSEYLNWIEIRICCKFCIPYSCCNFFGIGVQKRKVTPFVYKQSEWSNCCRSEVLNNVAVDRSLQSTIKKFKTKSVTKVLYNQFVPQFDSLSDSRCGDLG